ncbi:hypothetical protein BDZ91DRAFT_801994 [Kalaharituber pfeilii]|nr:hypothetical protein BDZ91DRAFT_801994 [Kalaharituber pfeilii]
MRVESSLVKAPDSDCVPGGHPRKRFCKRTQRDIRLFLTGLKDGAYWEGSPLLIYWGGPSFKTPTYPSVFPTQRPQQLSFWENVPSRHLVVGWSSDALYDWLSGLKPPRLDATSETTQSFLKATVNGGVSLP